MVCVKILNFFFIVPLSLPVDVDLFLTLILAD